MRRFLLGICILTLIASPFGVSPTAARFQAGPEPGTPVVVIGQDGAELA